MKNIRELFTRLRVTALLMAVTVSISVLMFVTPTKAGANIVEEVRKSANQTVTSQTPVNDNELIIPLQANRTYIIDGALFMHNDLSGNCRIAFTFPTGAVVSLGIVNTAINGGANTATFKESGTYQDLKCAEVSAASVISGTIKMGGAGGELRVQEANGDTGSTSMTVEEGSWLRSDKL